MNLLVLARGRKLKHGLGLLLLFALVAGIYTSMRYGNWRLEADEYIQAVASESIVADHVLDGGVRYNNGFAYGALLAFIGQISGISPYQLLAWGNIWIVIIALAAFITYRELLSDTGLALLSTLLLFMIPDFLFYVLRGGHERVTWMLALLMVYLLARSLRYVSRPALLLANIVSFYLVFWAMTSVNVYFAATFVNAIILALLGAWLLGLISDKIVKNAVQRQQFLSRLLTLSFACLILVFIFINYTYWPAFGFYYIAGDLFNRLALLIFGAQQTESPASFAYLGKAWINTSVYRALVWPQFLLAGASFGGWLINLRKQYSFNDRRWLLWWFYTAFGVLMVISTAADFAGFLNQNLQLRMFTPFAMFIAPLSALVLRSLLEKLSRNVHVITTPVIGLFVVYGLLASMIKVTLEPFVSNTWMFFTPAEQQAGRWMNQHIGDAVTWVDTWQNLPILLKYSDGYDTDRNATYLAGRLPQPAPYIFITEKTQMRANRIGVVLPETLDHYTIYDNSFARLYYHKPPTPYQR